MRISDNGIALIKAHEGLRLHAYDDLRPHGVLTQASHIEGTVTIGYGHTKTAEVGMVISRGEAELLLRDDVRHFETGLNKLIAECKVESLGQHQYDALISFAYNVGLNALVDSTLWAKLLQGRYSEAAEEFLRWRYSKGRELPGLVKRRMDERSMFLGFKPERTT